MAFKRVGRSVALNAFAAVAGLAGTFYIVWFFGLSEFAYFTINSAKLALLLLAGELLPSNFSIFRLQDDPRFASAAPVYYLGLALCAAAAAAALETTGLFAHASWWMVLFVFSSAIQRYFDTQAQASGRVDAFFLIPAASSVVRLLLLVGFSQLTSWEVPDIIWASVAIGSFLGQALMITRFPEFFSRESYRKPVGKLHYLWSIRGAYYGYYANSVLKRLRDTFLPLFCDLAIPSKAEIGRLLVFIRANEAVCGQVRVLEAFMVNRAVRENLRHHRRQIFWTIGLFGQMAVAVIALALMYRHGIGSVDVMLALATGAFIYPYILEIFWRNDALAAFRPRQVTFSLVAFLAGLAIPPLSAFALGSVNIPLMIFSYILGQTLAAATYRLFPGSRSDVSASERRA